MFCDSQHLLEEDLGTNSRNDLFHINITYVHYNYHVFHGSSAVLRMTPQSILVQSNKSTPLDGSVGLCLLCVFYSKAG